VTDRLPRDIFAELDSGPWLAEITQTGRWMRHIRIHRGLTQITPGSFALGQKRAERKARRLLARAGRDDQRRVAAVTITGGTT